MIDLSSGEMLGLGLGETGVVAADSAHRYAAVGGKQLVLWDLTSGDRVFAVPETANALQWSGPCDGGGRCRLVTAGETLDVWDPSTARRIRLSDQTNAEAVAISTDGSVVASAGWGPTVASWRVAPLLDNSGRAELAASGMATSIDPVTLHVARATSATSIEIAGGDAPVRVDTGTFERFVLAPNSRRIVTTTSDGRIHLFDAANGAAVAISSCTGDLMVVSPGGEMVATFASDTLVASVCEMGSGSLIATGKLSSKASALAVDDTGSLVMGDATGFVTVLPVAPDGKHHFATGRAIDARSGREPAEVRSLSMLNGVVAAGLHASSGRLGGKHALCLICRCAMN